MCPRFFWEMFSRTVGVKGRFEWIELQCEPQTFTQDNDHDCGVFTLYYALTALVGCMLALLYVLPLVNCCCMWLLFHSISGIHVQTSTVESEERPAPQKDHGLIARLCIRS